MEIKSIQYQIVKVETNGQKTYYELHYKYDYEYNWFERLLRIQNDNDWRVWRSGYEIVKFDTHEEAKNYINDSIVRRTTVETFEVEL